MEGEKKITRVHAVQSKRKAGVFCVFEECRASLSYGGFQQHFIKQHLPKVSSDAAAADQNAEPPTWDSQPFRDLYSVNRSEPARLAKYGLLEAASTAQLQDDVARLTQLVQEQGAMLTAMSQKISEIAEKIVPPVAAPEPEPATVSEPPAAPEPPGTPPAKAEPATKAKRKSKKRPLQSPSRSSPRRPVSRKAKKGIDEALI